jgi:hypothetical protein
LPRKSQAQARAIQMSCRYRNAAAWREWQRQIGACLTGQNEKSIRRHATLGKRQHGRGSFFGATPHIARFGWKKIQPFIGVNGFIDCDAAGNSWPYLDDLRTRFGVENPSPPQDTTLSRFTANSIRWVQNDWGEDQRISLERHQVAFIFDLTRPLRRQFEMPEKSAAREQEDRRKSGAINLKASRNELKSTFYI